MTLPPCQPNQPIDHTWQSVKQMGESLSKILEIEDERQRLKLLLISCSALKMASEKISFQILSPEERWSAPLAEAITAFFVDELGKYENVLILDDANTKIQLAKDFSEWILEAIRPRIKTA